MPIKTMICQDRLATNAKKDREKTLFRTASLELGAVADDRAAAVWPSTYRDTPLLLSVSVFLQMVVL